MKLTAVSDNTIKNTTNNNNNNNAKKRLSFRGFADSAVVMWDIIDAGGRALQFTVEDMLGTNFPRTYKGAMSGYKHTKKINFPSLLQEGIREFLTGPIMSIAPYVILGVATALGGKSANTHITNIENLSYIAGKLPNSVDKNNFKGVYFENVIQDMLKQTLKTDKLDDNDVKTLLDGINEYDSILENIKQLATRKEKKAAKAKAKEILNTMQNNFERIIKSKKANFKDTDFQVAKFSLDNAKTASANFENYIGYTTAFANDYLKENAKGSALDLAENTIKAFKKNWIGKRVITIISMIALTGVIMSFIPKLYTLASGKKNPDTKVYTDIAKEKEDKQ